jgi:hypothetical protein
VLRSLLHSKIEYTVGKVLKNEFDLPNTLHVVTVTVSSLSGAKRHNTAKKRRPLKFDSPWRNNGTRAISHFWQVTYPLIVLFNTVFKVVKIATEVCFLAILKQCLFSRLAAIAAATLLQQTSPMTS